ncbi:ABC-three component system protein [Chryseobacterium sp.]|uniref:ABC-three component system protein n=1 Tax=Chryseobacterium sp. TaxID=1871047 RepID=UPI0031E10D7D
MSTDATASWSGYIFQGEVALCKAIEVINTHIGEIPDHFCLRLEQDEDFSIKTNLLQVFQVKGYLSKNSDRLSKYKSVIIELIEKYHYAKKVEKAPFDGKQLLESYRINKRKRPIYCSLITDKIIVDFQADLASFIERYRTIDFKKFSVIQGIYTIQNITNKIDEEIAKLFPPDCLTSEDIALKRNYCLNNIVNLIKERHHTKKIKTIPLNEIKGWLNKPDIVLNEDLFWLTIVQAFLKTFSEPLFLYNRADPQDASWHDKLSECYEKISELPFDSIKKMIKERLNAHKGLNARNMRENLARYMDDAIIYNIINKAIEGINIPPNYENLVFDLKDEKYQLSLMSCKIDNPPTTVDKIKLQNFLKNIQDNNLNDIDYIITEQITFDSNSVADLKRNITDVPETFGDSTIEITNPTRNFALKKLSESIKDLNS